MVNIFNPQPHFGDEDALIKKQAVTRVKRKSIDQDVIAKGVRIIIEARKIRDEYRGAQLEELNATLSPG